jgi:CRISPR-associated protein Csb3
MDSGDGRNPFKLFAGQQIAVKIMRNMLNGNNKGKGLKHIMDNLMDDDYSDPFGIICPLSGRFGFDARGSWEALEIGFSNDKLNYKVEASPLVELLSPIGLENCRPTKISTYYIKYQVWSNILPLSLCRVIFSLNKHDSTRNITVRSFIANLGSDQQYKKCFFASEESEE